MQGLGNLFNTVGTKLRLPELGLSERFGVTGGSAPQSVYPTTSNPNRGVLSMSTSQNQTNRPMGPDLPPGGLGGLNGATTTNTTGGGGGGAAPIQQQQGNQGAPMEQTQGQPSIDFDALIRPALDALGQAEQAAQGIFSAGEAEADANATSLTGRAELQKSQSEQDLAGRAASEQQRGTSAIDEQRRGLSEIQQGLQARFGSSVSTGSAAAGIAGAEALRNISGIRTALQTSLNDIETTKQGVNDLFNQQIKEIESSTTAIKAQARSSLQQALAEIGSTRGQLQSRKAELVMQTMQQYQQQVADVNARNTAFQQQLYAQKQAAEQQLVQAQQTAAQRLKTLEPFSVSAGETRYIPLTQFGGEEGFNDFTGTKVPGMTTGIQGPYGVISSPQSGDDDAVAELERALANQGKPK